jgi:DNA-binding transcriptional ArsR family regulator
MAEKFVMVSLEEKKAKKLATALSNSTSRKILNYLAEKEATALEISNKLDIQLSTLKYSIKNLIDAGLIESTEFRWSKKGREMSIYKLKRKYIIIAPEKSEELKKTLKKILPVGLAGFAVAGLIQFASKLNILSKQATFDTSKNIMEMTQTNSPELISNIPQIIAQSTNNGLYFLLGVIFSLALYIIIERRTKK